jgi:hypothetical protein
MTASEPDRILAVMPIAAVLWTDVGAFAILAAQLLVLVVAAIVAWRQVGEARKLREEQTRPFVVLDFDAHEVLIYLTLKNLGTTLARNVRVTVEPSFKSALDDHTERLAALQMFTERGIPTLAPGKEFGTLFDVATQRKPENDPSGKGLPDVYVAHIQYEDPAGRRFAEDVILDLGVYWGLQYVKESDLGDIRRELKALVGVAQKWTASGGGLLRLSPAEVEARFAARRTELEARRRELEADAQGPPD